MPESGADFGRHELWWIYGRSSEAFYAQAANGSTGLHGIAGRRRANAF